MSATSAPSTSSTASTSSTSSTASTAPRTPGAPDGAAPPDRPERTIGQLVAGISDDLKAVVTAEVALAKLEVQTSLRDAVKGAPLLVVAGVLALYALGLLLTAAAWALALVWPTWLAFLAVALVVLLLVAVLVLVGIRLLKKVDPTPERAIANAQETIAALKSGQRSGAEHAALVPASRSEAPLRDRRAS